MHILLLRVSNAGLNCKEWSLMRLTVHSGFRVKNTKAAHFAPAALEPAEVTSRPRGSGNSSPRCARHRKCAGSLRIAELGVVRENL